MIHLSIPFFRTASQLGETVAVAGRVTAAAAKGALKRGTDGAGDEGGGLDDLAALKSRAGERYRAVCGTRAVTDDDTAVAAASAGVDAGAAEGAGVGELLVSCSDDFTLFLWSPATDKKPLVRLTGHQQAVNHIAFSPGISSRLQNNGKRALCFSTTSPSAHPVVSSLLFHSPTLVRRIAARWAVLRVGVVRQEGQAVVRQDGPLPLHAERPRGLRLPRCPSPPHLFDLPPVSWRRSR
jgi:hypothetical protein